MNCSIIYVFVTCVLIEQIYTIHNKYSLTSSSSSTIFAFYTRPEDPQLAGNGRGWRSSYHVLCTEHVTLRRVEASRSQASGHTLGSPEEPLPLCWQNVHSSWQRQSQRREEWPPRAVSTPSCHVCLLNVAHGTGQWQGSPGVSCSWMTHNITSKLILFNHTDHKKNTKLYLSWSSHNLQTHFSWKENF